MQRFRFLHCADLHLDTPFRGMSDLPEAIRSKLLRSTFDALDSIVALSVQERVDFVLIAGDVYDAADRSLRAQIRFQRALQAWSSHGIRVFIVHGNHDPSDGRAAKLAWPDGVHAFSSDKPETVDVVCPKRGTLAQIHGMSFKTAAVYDNLAARLTGMPRKTGVYQIGLLHTNVDGDAGHDNYAPCSKRELIGSGLNYWALGHIHTRGVLNGGDGSVEPAVVYPGNIQGRSVRECGAKGCSIVDVDEEGGTHVTFHAADAVRWVIEKIDISGLETEQELQDEIEHCTESLRGQAEGRSVIVRLLLEGRGPAHDWLRSGTFLDELVAELRDAEAAHYSTGGWDAHEYDTLPGREQEIGRVAGQTTGQANGQTTGPAPFVWIESIVDQTGRVVDIEHLRAEQSLVGDMLRMANDIQMDGKLLAAFRGEALATLLTHSKAAKRLAEDGSQDEETRELLRAAEEMLIDALADGGWNG